MTKQLCLMFCVFVALGATGSPVHAQVDVTITADNAYGFGYGTGTEITTLYGGIENCGAIDIFGCAGPESYPNIPPGGDGFLYIVAYSDNGGTQGVLAQFVAGINRVYTGTTDWQVYATPPGNFYTNCGGPIDLPSKDAINLEIGLANSNSGGPGSSVGWVGPSGAAGSVGALAIGEPNDLAGSSSNCGTSQNVFPVVCGMDAVARWMWYEPSLSTTTPFCGGIGGRYLIFRLPITQVTEPKIELSLTKSVDNNTPHIGDTVNYAITVCNTGNVPVSPVTIDDALPAGLVSAGGTFTYPTHIVSILAPSQCVTLTLAALVTASTIVGDTVTNCATIQEGAWLPSGSNCADIIVAPNGKICGRSWRDVDGDGVRTSGEVGLSNRQINLTGPSGTAMMITDANGDYCFSGLPAGAYSLDEVTPSDWRKTYPPTGTHSITLAAEEERGGVDFGSITGCVAGPEDMVAWWPLDEPKSPAISFSKDIAGAYPNNGIWTGDLTRPNFEPDGKVNGAIAFGPLPGDPLDPSQTVNVPDHPEIDFGTGSLSVDAWIRTSDTSPGVHPIIDKRDGSESQPRGYHVFLYSGQLGFQLGDGSAFVGNFLATGPSLADGTWHHVAVTAQRPGGIVTLYVDGTVDPLSTPTPTLKAGDVSNTSQLRIGNVTLGSPKAFRGNLDEIEMFKRALSEGEVRSIWAADSSGKCRPGQILGSVFNDLNGNATRDAGELGIKDWTVTISGPVGRTTTTDSLGAYYFMELPVGIYTVTQVSQSGWNQTTPAGGSYTVILDHGQVASNQDFGNHSTVTGASISESPRAIFSLSQNHPNPFNPVTAIQFSVAQNCRARMFVYDVRGSLVATLVDRILPAGEYRVQWDGRDDRGIAVASGVYFYHLEAGTAALTRRMALLR